MPLLIYVSREKIPSQPHHFKVGALNVLVLWKGYDGLGGPCVCGTGYYIKRVSLCESSISEAGDAMKLRQCFGPSNEFIKSLRQINKPDHMFIQRNNAQPNETQLLASCAYEDGTKWGKEVGFLYGSVVEDYFTGFHLHGKGWISVYCDPKRPQFLGSGTTNLDEFLVQGTRWSSGLVDVAISKFSTLIYGPFKTPTFLHSMCYAELTLFPIFYFLSLWGFATIPQLCLLNGIPLYPQRIWMMKSVTSHLYGSVDAFMKKLGMREASFFPTNKVNDVEQLKRYNWGVFDFQTSLLFLAPMVALVILNMAWHRLLWVKRLIAKRLLKHSFLKSYRGGYYLMKNLLLGLPSIEERFKKIKDLGRFMSKKEEKEEEDDEGSRCENGKVWWGGIVTQLSSPSGDWEDEGHMGACNGSVGEPSNINKGAVEGEALPMVGEESETGGDIG
ncbi:cellulose synthase-like protein G2 [Malus sylvestris]|uniref:cellulose synthase-like protein G2 n=1 Tax=Malus sylvestris TaxID=3752 RepID=UPI0021AC4E55|nr:cellulose synthase-like protein G2 [Malus sylvestris]